jgi:hypothetical protein
MRRLLSAILVIATLLCLVSCGEKNREYDESEVLYAAERLIRRSKTLNGIYWGEGIRYYEDAAFSNGAYYPADPEHLLELGIETVDDLKELTRKTFSAEYSESIFRSKLSSMREDEYFGYARYYQGIDRIMVYSDAVSFLDDEVNYLYETLAATGSKGETVFVKLSVEISDGVNTQTRELEVGLVEEEDGWKIDTPTYMSYQN